MKDSVFVHEFSALLQLCEEYSVSVSSLSRYSRDIISIDYGSSKERFMDYSKLYRNIEGGNLNSCITFIARDNIL